MSDSGFMDIWPTYDDKSVTGELGVGLVQVAATRNLRWAFRNKPTIDLGIDGELEPRNLDGTSNGRIISVQIKCGKSFFRSPQERGFRYRPKPQHLNYWLAHTTPVVLVLVDDEAGDCYWQHVTAENLTIVDGVSLIDVPRDQKLDQRSLWKLRSVADGFQQVDLVRQLFRIWLVESSLFTYSWSNEFQIHRDFHGMDLFMADMPGRGDTAADIVLGRPGFGEHEDGELSDIHQQMRRNHAVAGCDHALIGLVSGNLDALDRKQLPTPPKESTVGLTLEYVPLLLREDSLHPHLVEVGHDRLLIDDGPEFNYLRREFEGDVAQNEAFRRSHRMWGSL